MRRSGVVVVLALAAAASVALPRRADACGAFYEAPAPRVRVKKPTEKVDLVARANEAVSHEIDGEHTAEAFASIARGYPNLREASKAESLGAMMKPLHAAALALARAEGDGKVAAFEARTAADRAANLTWAVATMQAINATRPNDPALLADLGEVMSHAPSLKREAAELLGGLAAKDLIGSPQAYAALARLRTDAGDVKGADDARSRCAAMTKTPEQICGARAGRPGA